MPERQTEKLPESSNGYPSSEERGSNRWSKFLSRIENIIDKLPLYSVAFTLSFLVFSDTEDFNNKLLAAAVGLLSLKQIIKD